KWTCEMWRGILREKGVMQRCGGPGPRPSLTRCPRLLPADRALATEGVGEGSHPVRRHTRPRRPRGAPGNDVDAPIAGIAGRRRRETSTALTGSTIPRELRSPVVGKNGAVDECAGHH